MSCPPLLLTAGHRHDADHASSGKGGWVIKVGAVFQVEDKVSGTRGWGVGRAKAVKDGVNISLGLIDGDNTRTKETVTVAKLL